MLHWPKSNPLASATGTVSTIGQIRHTLDQLFFKKNVNDIYMALHAKCLDLFGY